MPTLRQKKITALSIIDFLNWIKRNCFCLHTVGDKIKFQIPFRGTAVKW